MGYFTVWNSSPRIPIVANIPHSSPFVPHDVRDQFLIDDDELNRQIGLLTDWYTDELYAPAHECGGAAVRYDVSRFVVDPKHVDDEGTETAAGRGMGVIYTCGIDGKVIRRTLTERDRKDLLDRFYRPHQKSLLEATETCLRNFGRCTVMDCHSFRSRATAHELDHAGSRPDVVIGTDWHHTPHEMVETIRRLVRQRGWSVKVDQPFTGAYIPLPYYGDGRISAFSIGINTKLYMDEPTTSLTEGFHAVRDLIADIVSATCEG